MKPYRALNAARRAAFTLVELLAVIAILGLLAAIGSRTLYAAKERTRISQCRAELACLTQALADYQRAHCDFPLAGCSAEMSASRLFAAITADAGVDISRFPTATLDIDQVAFVDPWGNPYIYFYRSAAGAEWRQDGFLLFSAGPDGLSVGPDATGRFVVGRHAAAVNADNIYSDEPP